MLLQKAPDKGTNSNNRPDLTDDSCPQALIWSPSTLNTSDTRDQVPRDSLGPS